MARNKYRHKFPDVCVHCTMCSTWKPSKLFASILRETGYFAVTLWFKTLWSSEPLQTVLFLIVKLHKDALSSWFALLTRWVGKNKLQIICHFYHKCIPKFPFILFTKHVCTAVDALEHPFLARTLQSSVSVEWTWHVRDISII